MVEVVFSVVFDPVSKELVVSDDSEFVSDVVVDGVAVVVLTLVVIGDEVELVVVLEVELVVWLEVEVVSVVSVDVVDGVVVSTDFVELDVL